MSRRTLLFVLPLAGAALLSVAFNDKALSTPPPEGEEPEASKKEAAATDEAEKAENTEKAAEPEVAIDPSLGILEGRVVLEGPPPEFDQKIEVPANHQDRAHCVDHVKDERVILGEKKELKNVVVSVEDYRPRERPEPRVVRIDNRNCLFVPHVLATTVGSTLELTNSDSFIHNSRGLLTPLSGINSAIPPNGGKVEKKLRRPGWGVMKCDFHPWMQAHVHVFQHDLFAVSAEDGTFRIVNIPPGTHKIRLWHEVLAPKTIEVQVEAGKTTRLDESLERRKLD